MSARTFFMSGTEKHIRKKLYIRLSSLGDVILAMSALSVAEHSQSALPEDVSPRHASPRHVSIDWLVAKEFASLLNEHPHLGKVWSFDRKQGFKGWKALGRKLWEEGYDEVYDLHRTLRTRVLKFLFLYWSITEGRTAATATARRSVWRVISKQRVRLYGYFIFKSLWPKALRPSSMTSRSARLVGGSGKEKPNLKHLLTSSASRTQSSCHELLAQLHGKNYICVMPGSKWAGKKWPAESFANLLVKMPHVVPVVMGTPTDQESLELVKLLEQRGSAVVSAVGAWSFSEVAQILSGAWRYLGNDTGLAHLAEAVGVPSYVIFGPTREDMGFGPWRAESLAVGKSLSCRPCGKDGRFCYRLNDRFACMKKLSADEVLAQIPETQSARLELHQ